LAVPALRHDEIFSLEGELRLRRGVPTFRLSCCGLAWVSLCRARPAGGDLRHHFDNAVARPTAAAAQGDAQEGGLAGFRLNDLVAVTAEANAAASGEQKLAARCLIRAMSGVTTDESLLPIAGRECRQS
jgi:hypothetical protein